jgi:maleamate amidohydrolase
MSENVHDNYKGVFDNRIGFGERPALLMVDFVEAYFDRDCELYAGVEAALASALRIRAAARRAKVPVILTNVAFHDSMIDAGVFFRKVKPLRHLRAGSKFGAWPKGLVPEPDELIVTKQYPSAFFGTSLAATLTAARIDSVVITGLTTSGCVRATCVDACSNGFIPIVVSEACGDRAPEPHRANLFDMNAKYADVVDEADALAYFASLKT